MNLKQLITFISTALILLSCAQIVPLSGGEKDIEPPKEVESSPQNEAINFVEKTITIEFDEFIKLNNVASQLIVSPLMETAPEILVKGKKLVIKIESELAENTTYSLNFGNAITDITENNVFPNYKYVFSTGTYIDSLSYSGTVVSSFGLSPKENIYVLLYDQFGDSIPYKELPRYVALTDKEGKFSITNIANGKYKFFAIDDINGNYLFDLPNEEIAFKSESIQLDSASSDNRIYLFAEESALQYVVKAENSEYGKIDIVLNLPTNNVVTQPLNKRQWIVDTPLYINIEGDTIIQWMMNPNDYEVLDFIIGDIVSNDSVFDGNFLTIDTLNISLKENKLKDSILSIRTNINTIFDLNKNIILTSHRPLQNLDTNEIKLLEDSVRINYNLIKKKIGLNAYREFDIDYPFKESTNYQLFIPPGTFEDIYGLKNDTVKIDFKTKSESDYGIINLDINPNFSDNYIIQLFKGKKLIEENNFKGDIKTSYKYLAPGNYELKLIIDSNNDKKWNTGNYLENLQPEKVIYYEKEIKIRANWDNDIVWTVNE